MVKVSSQDIIAILRRFEVAGEENTPRHIEQITFNNTTPLNTVVAFRFRKRNFFILFDDDAHDDPQYITTQLTQVKNGVMGDLLPNLTHTDAAHAMKYRDSDVYVFEITAAKRRIDTELSQRYPETSRSTWQKYIKAGHVSVNGEVMDSPKATITDADAISIDLPDATDYSDHELPIVYIDDDIIVINKPVGVLSHAKGVMSDEFTVADFFGRYSSYNADTNRPGIVHRLDRDTSGNMIGARNEATATMLQKQFADRKTKKTYIAIVDG
ncbi:MAG: pseudouridine synthase, partial [Candidatus Saccharimonadales bacterium]